jgi:hypothetical protein
LIICVRLIGTSVEAKDIAALLVVVVVAAH